MFDLHSVCEDKGLVQLREGYDRYRGVLRLRFKSKYFILQCSFDAEVYHMRSLVKSWRSGEPGDVNGSYLTWLLRDLLTGQGGENSILFAFFASALQAAVSRLISSSASRRESLL